MRVAVLTPQVLSLVSGAYYTYVFHSYTKSDSDEWSTLKSHYAAGCVQPSSVLNRLMLMLKYMMLSARSGLMSIVTMALAFFRPFDTAANPIRSYEMCGQIGVVSSVLLSVGPGATILKVLKTGNTSSMPFYQSLLAWLNNIGWTSYGWFVSRDPLAWGPNLLGLFFTTCQMLAFAMYGVQRLEKQEDKKP